MLAQEALPDLLPHAPFLMAGLLIVFWVYMKVRLVRQRIAARGPDEDPPQVPAWQLRLARAGSTSVVLAVLAILLIAALAWFGVVAA